MRDYEEFFDAADIHRSNRPCGGFFVVVTTPFLADDKALEYSAREHGVLWMPMRLGWRG